MDGDTITRLPAATDGAGAAPAWDATTLPYLLRLGDACLVHAQRLAEWCGHAPVLEEDIALTNLALDQLGQARALLSLAGRCEGRGRDEDALAYQRGEAEFLNPSLLELPHTPPGDSAPCFGRTLLRGFLWASFAQALYRRLADSRDPALAGIAARALKECRYHAEHCADWVVRLGDGTAESQRRMQAALEDLWPYTAELFEDDAVDRAVAAAGLGPAWAELRPAWLASVEPVLREATLRMPPDTPFRSHGRRGRHTEAMGLLLAEMQSLARAFPGAVW
ncbi:1,2-phenylacetyl-CoA epoxidase subunit PaaC [Piscinibacter sakaiensis]|uniref:Phenylacetate-CoA oxygenase, PaaI subunit n=1 Tax=Piscinibacter sakaiensis TaxID=1547922 RepID=A0A0K8NWG9_PISS1|nr:1,2-phenylacetyl-CoA epoxidase subunit PaaC [Piscinibacter sakaiensis]GAP34742.1 phenylacetate-CoA oxygenase, PaaI subunit [Piscinibacter sakaiensis]